MARIQKLESDSSFNLSYVPGKQVLVYTVQENGQVVHKAKLHNGNIVTVGIKPAQNTILYYDAIPTASASIAGKTVLYTGTTGLYTKGHTYRCQEVQGVYTWVDITALKDEILHILSNSYYDKQQINQIVSGLASDSLITQLWSHINDLQDIKLIHSVNSTGIINVQSNSGYVTLQLSADSNAFSISQNTLYTNLTIAKLNTPQQGFAATYQLQGADGVPIGDKINVIRDRYIQPPTFIRASQEDLIIDPTLTVDDPYLKFIFYSQSDSASGYDSVLYVPLKDLVDTYTAGNGITLQDNQLSLVADSNSNTTKYLEIGTNTIGLKGIDQAIDDVRDQLILKINQLSDSINIGNYYTKGQVDAFLSDISNSLSNIKNKFSTYYTSSYIDTLVGDISDSTIAGAIKKKAQLPTGGSTGQFLQKTAVGTQWADLNMPKAVYVAFNQVDQQGYASFTGYGLPIGILAPSGNYYPVQKRSVQINTTTEITKIQVAPYVAYQNQSSFQGTWTACFPSPETGVVTVVVSPTQPVYPSDGTIWIQG